MFSGLKRSSEIPHTWERLCDTLTRARPWRRLDVLWHIKDRAGKTEQTPVELEASAARFRADSKGQKLAESTWLE